jgi:hypothetical protein
MKQSNRSLGVAKRLGLTRLTPKGGFMTTLGYASYKIGGKSRFMELARLSDDVDVKKIIAIWDKLSKSDKRYVSLDDLCKAAGVNEHVLLSAIIPDNPLSYIAWNIIIESMLNRPNIVQTTINKALKPNGYKYRVKFMKGCALY